MGGEHTITDRVLRAAHSLLETPPSLSDLASALETASGYHQEDVQIVLDREEWIGDDQWAREVVDELQQEREAALDPLRGILDGLDCVYATRIGEVRERAELARLTPLAQQLRPYREGINLPVLFYASKEQGEDIRHYWALVPVPRQKTTTLLEQELKKYFCDDSASSVLAGQEILAFSLGGREGSFEQECKRIRRTLDEQDKPCYGLIRPQYRGSLEIELQGRPRREDARTIHTEEERVAAAILYNERFEELNEQPPLQQQFANTILTIAFDGREPSSGVMRTSEHWWEEVERISGLRDRYTTERSWKQAVRFQGIRVLRELGILSEGRRYEGGGSHREYDVNVNGQE
ncbi:hypothetical protein GF342_00925 [Candidatus Woesearchaeota archaeon]|nr:hypothetical protein [Candidatus Woesearchaeota archaeon]